MMLLSLYIPKSMGGLVGKSFLSRCAAGLFLLLSASIASAAGLGKLTVISALGQPFRAEIDLVSVTKEEQALLNVRLASPEAFRQADIPFTTFISNLKVSIDNRSSGEQFIRVSSTQPLNEPFVDFLVELYWSSGRLVRAYTALVDPPSTAEAPGGGAEVKALPPAQVLDGAAAPGPAPAFVEPQPAGSRNPMPEGVQSQGVDVEPGLAQAPAGPGGAVVPEPSAQMIGGPGVKAPVTSSASEHTVKRGDTLARIAAANKPAEVSLDQMLVSLFRANPESFAGKNMNRLKVGTVLRVPDAASADDVPAAEARREVRAQAANWNAYREKLAAVAGAGPAMAAAPSQSASGKVGSVTEDKSASASDAPKEVLKLSKGEVEKPGGAPTAKAGPDRVRTLEEELAAKNRALGEANQRVAVLEKTVKDMELLMEIKSKGMSEAQKAAEAGKPASPPGTEAARSPEPPKPDPSKGQGTGDSAPKTDASGMTGSEQPKASEQPPAPSPPAAESAEQPKPKPKPRPVPPPPPPPPSFLDQLMEDPLVLAGAAAALLGAGGLGFAAYRRRKGGGSAKETKPKGGKGGKKNSSVASNPDDDEQIEGTVNLASGSGPADSDLLGEVDRLLTYGRYDLAEQRLQEGIAEEPTRYELHGKLLEIHAYRQNTVAFEQVAREVQIGTGGRGEVWDKAVRLGYQIDPENPRYAAGRSADSPGTSTMALGAASLAATAEALGSTDLDFNLDLDTNVPAQAADIDLSGLGGGADAGAVTPTDIDLSALGGTVSDGEAFDPGATLSGASHQETIKMQAQPPEAALATDTIAGLDFNIDLPELSTPSGSPDATSPAKPAGGTELDFDIDSLNLGSGPVAELAAPDIDLSGIDLALGGPSTTPPADGSHDEHWYDVQTKFDLAKAYQEMGDREGAREVLLEVIAEGDAQQKQAAEQVLASLD